MGREALPVVRNGTVGPSRGLVAIGRPTRRFRMGCEAYPEVRERWESLPKGLWWVGRPNRKPGIGQQSITEVWEASGVPSGGLGGPPDPPWTYRWASRPLSTPSRPSVGLPVLSRPSVWASQPVPNLRVGFPTPTVAPVGIQTPPGHPSGTPDPGRTFGWASRTSG